MNWILAAIYTSVWIVAALTAIHNFEKLWDEDE